MHTRIAASGRAKKAAPVLEFLHIFAYVCNCIHLHRFKQQLINSQSLRKRLCRAASKETIKYAARRCLQFAQIVERSRSDQVCAALCQGSGMHKRHYCSWRIKLPLQTESLVHSRGNAGVARLRGRTERSGARSTKEGEGGKV